ncbi:MAG: thiamine pyrophosphate-binding protein [Elusimicrobia bacterium]|nr:thiamine pyrophosphate-binding protein [Elusimicrobiota bacterium]
MKITGGRLVVKALEDEGVRWTLGIPGTHNTELYDCLHDSNIEPILVTDEQSASFMADAISRTSDQVGVVNVVPGAGVTHCLSGVAEAYMDNVPMVVLTCGIRTDTGRAYQLHDVDQMAILRPITKEALTPKTPQEIYSTIRHAFAVARAGTPGPVAVQIPANFYILHDEHVSANGDFQMVTMTPVPSSEKIEEAAALLKRSQKILLYVGNGAKRAQSELVKMAEFLGSPVATTVAGKGVFPENHPLWLWNGLGNAAPPFVRDVAGQCDTMLAIGCRFSEVATASYGFEIPETLIHVDINKEVFNRNYRATLAIEADARGFIEALRPRLSIRQRDESWERTIREGHEALWKEWLGKPNPSKVSPPWLYRTLQQVLGPQAIYVTDSGNGTFLTMELLRLHRPGQFIGPFDYSCMGYCVPAAIGAKLANPDIPVAALAGDGALLMTGLEMLTAAQNKLGVMVFVLRDGELGQIAQFQRTSLNRDTCSILPDYDLQALAKAVGAEYVDLPHDLVIENVIRQAQDIAKTGRPVFVDVAIDYSRRTFFTKGVVKTNFLRFPWPERLRKLGRAVMRHTIGAS